MDKYGDNFCMLKKAFKVSKTHLTVLSLVLSAAGIAAVVSHAPAQSAQNTPSAPTAQTVQMAQAVPPPAIVRGLPDFSELVDQVGPSVVNIRTLERSNNARSSSGSGMDEEMQDFFRRCEAVEVNVRNAVLLLHSLRQRQRDIMHDDVYLRCGSTADFLGSAAAGQLYAQLDACCR